MPKPLEDTFRVPTECTYLILNPQLNLEGSYARKKFKKEEKTTKKLHSWGCEAMK